MDLSEVKHLPKVDHTPAELDAASRLLLKAADMIEVDGFWKNGCYAHNDGAGHCVVLAIGRAGANDGGPDEQAARARFARHAGLRYSDTETIYKWNDARDRTKAEVIAKLRAAALGG